MKSIKKIIPSEVMFIILILIGIILKFIPALRIFMLTVIYLICQLVCVSFISYRKNQLLEMKDLYCTILISCLMILLFHDAYTSDEWFYLIFSIGISTAYLGCNQRFNFNRNHSFQMEMTKH